MSVKQISNGKFVFAEILEYLGMIGVICSSLFILIIVVYRHSFDPWMPVWVLIAFGISILLLVTAARLAGDKQRAKTFFGQLPIYVMAFACVGLVKFLLLRYHRRVPHHLNQEEWHLVYLLIIALGALTFCICHFQSKAAKCQVNEADVFVPSNIETSAQRILKPGPQLFILLGIPFGLMALLFGIVGFEIGTWVNAVEAGSGVLGIYGVICLFLAGNIIIIGTDFVAFKYRGKSAKAVRFKDITKSREHGLWVGGTPGVSVVLDIYTRDRKRPALRIPVKPFKSTEIEWLRSLPEMKFH